MTYFLTSVTTGFVSVQWYVASVFRIPPLVLIRCLLPGSGVVYDSSPFLIPGASLLSPCSPQVPLPGYIEAYPRSRYQQNSPSRLPRQYSQPAGMHPSLEQAPVPSTAASQQSLADNDPSDTPLTNISTAALVKAIREEVAKLAKKQTDMFEFQV